jgi:hypothetical protein
MIKPTTATDRCSSAPICPQTKWRCAVATAFPTNGYACEVSQFGGGTAGLAAPGYQSLSASGVTINNNQASTQNITWTCFGNWAGPIKALLEMCGING